MYSYFWMIYTKTTPGDFYTLSKGTDKMVIIIRK